VPGQQAGFDELRAPSHSRDADTVRDFCRGHIGLLAFNVVAGLQARHRPIVQSTPPGSEVVESCDDSEDFGGVRQSLVQGVGCLNRGEAGRQHLVQRGTVTGHACQPEGVVAEFAGSA
jgi:hypothetical protein